MLEAQVCAHDGGRQVLIHPLKYAEYGIEFVIVVLDDDLEWTEQLRRGQCERLAGNGGQRD